MSIDKKFKDWIYSSRVLQIRYISLLTAGLYLIYGFIDNFVAPKEYLYLFHLVHIYIIPFSLFIIAFLTFFKRLHNFMILLLIIAPIFSSFGNFIILRVLESPTIYFPELYLSIFWVFTLSGLRLKPAVFTATIMGSISIISVFSLMDTITKEQFVLHIFWIFCATSLGFLGAYLIEKFTKEIFLSKEAISKLAVTDKLTGLFNRAKFDEVIEVELSRAKRYDYIFSLMIIDIDHFKAVNDTYGHSVGDIFLKEISSLIKKNIRQTDVFVRWGGEEFAIISPQSNEKGILQLADNLNEVVRTHEFSHIGKKTISIGITLFASNDTSTTIVKRADLALYEAKNSGRNRAVLK